MRARRTISGIARTSGEEIQNRQQYISDSPWEGGELIRRVRTAIALREEFQAIKYRAWQHHLVLTIAASWFITETRLDWACQHEADPELLEHYEIDVLACSVDGKYPRDVTGRFTFTGPIH